MTGVLRLTLVSHAMTDAMAVGRFPVDEPLSELGRRQVDAVRVTRALGLRGEVHPVAAPEHRTQQTAQLLGLKPATERRLADLDCGGWRGLSLDDLGDGELEPWLTDPAAKPHGGESVLDLRDRVAGWLASLPAATAPRPTVAVTHPAVVRAAILLALDAPPASFWRIDVAPVSRTVLHFRGAAWTLRL
ncbi:histidine phosphatase family protein [Mycobacterium asiaticum]|uniref:histidine phosphatase family protein n=1 Tax=Mycobacterium asiaticum TaxID=1790 RepID=UPI00055D4A9B|nr:histidine phosphatase family protein [Mycobacterium asiaticum]OBI86178.1 histidine phosphatase [Mycobacterium asiaticum]ORA14064.1 histidine phosphatase family protein [Mycobacterium asiaticum DSM 44297]